MMCAAAACGQRYREEAGGRREIRGGGGEMMQRWIKREDAERCERSRHTHIHTHIHTHRLVIIETLQLFSANSLHLSVSTILVNSLNYSLPHMKSVLNGGVEFPSPPLADQLIGRDSLISSTSNLLEGIIRFR